MILTLEDSITDESGIHHRELLTVGIVGIVGQIVWHNLYWLTAILYGDIASMIWISTPLFYPFTISLDLLFGLGLMGVLWKYKSRLAFPILIIQISPSLLLLPITFFFGLLARLVFQYTITLVVAFLLYTVRDQAEIQGLLVSSCVMMVLSSFIPSMINSMLYMLNPFYAYVVIWDFYWILVLLFFLSELGVNVLRKIEVIDDYPRSPTYGKGDEW